jgi:hypothetical protein
MRVFVRASSWLSLMDCPARWHATNIMRKYLPSSPPALIGNAVHAGSATFDTARMNDAPINPDDAADEVIEYLRHPPFDVDWSHEQVFTKKTAERIALTLYTRYCNDISPMFDFSAVEKQCEPLDVDMGDDLVITLTGTLDRLYEIEPIPNLIQTGVLDLKSGGCRVNADGEVSAKTDGPQLGHYELLAEYETGEEISAPAIIAGMNTKGAMNVGTTELHNCKSHIIGTPDQPGMLQYAAAIFRSGSFAPNPKSQLCSARFCANGACRYNTKG